MKYETTIQFRNNLSRDINYLYFIRLQSSQYPVPEFDLGHELQQALGPEVSLTSTLTSTRPHSSLSDFPLPGYMSGTSSRPPSRPGEMYLPLPRPQHGFVPYGDRPRDQNVEVIEVQTVGKSVILVN